MYRCKGDRESAFTLVEVSLVATLLVLLSAIVIPKLITEIRGDALPRSARQLRSLVTLVHAHAAFDGKRYQIRFPREDEDPENLLIDDRQPLIEREDDPIERPEEFSLVTEPWAVGHTFLGDVWCARVRLGRPTIQLLQNERRQAAKDIGRQLAKELEDYEPERLPLMIQPDGTSEWVTFMLTTAARDVNIDKLQEYPTIDVIYEGETGLAWLQRPFYDEELDLFEEKGWPAVLRQDFLDRRVLTEDDVLEVREAGVRGYDVELKGQKMGRAEGARQVPP